MRLAALLLALVLMVPAAFAAVPQAGARPDHVADRDCLACHPDQAGAWAESKHRHAMQPATAQTVLGDFGDVRFGEGAAAARFFRRGGDFVVAAQGADGRTQELAASHVFGIRPLQQVLLPQEGGRLQAFTIAWDTTRKTWFSLHTDGPVPPGDNLHWSGRYQNWNLMCGECHTTAYRKGYDEEHDRYATTWAEPNVGCQACHGAGRAHAESAGRLAATGARAQRPVPTPNRALAGAHAQVDQCAACHARRTRLVEDAVAGAPLFDQFVPDNLRPGLYHADGQQLDEVFEYGSYRQSRMYQAGVACTDCHDPHRGRLRADGNALCTACHNPTPDRGRFPGLQPKDYDAPAHHFHRGGGAGSQCVDCHMPSRNYMVVHPRRDHAIRIPRPDLSARTGAPDACTGCHAERGAEWAAGAIEHHHGKRTHPPHYGERLAAARAGTPGAAAGLAALAGDAALPAIVRASAIEQLAQLDPGALPAAALRDPDPAVRTSAAAAFALRPAEERVAQLSPCSPTPCARCASPRRARSPTCPQRRSPPSCRTGSAPRWPSSSRHSRRWPICPAPSSTSPGSRSRKAMRPPQSSACAARCSASPRSTRPAWGWPRCSRRPGARTRPNASCATGWRAPPVPASSTSPSACSPASASAGKRPRASCVPPTRCCPAMRACAATSTRWSATWNAPAHAEGRPARRRGRRLRAGAATQAQPRSRLRRPAGRPGAPPPPSRAGRSAAATPG